MTRKALGIMRTAVIVGLGVAAIGTLAVPGRTMLWNVYESQSSSILLRVVHRKVIIIAVQYAATRPDDARLRDFKQVLEVTPATNPHYRQWHYTRFPSFFSAGAPCWGLSLLFATYPTIAFIRGPLRRWRRRRRNLCVECGYNLTGNESGVCPECGVTLQGEGFFDARG